MIKFCVARPTIVFISPPQKLSPKNMKYAFPVKISIFFNSHLYGPAINGNVTTVRTCIHLTTDMLIKFPKKRCLKQ